MAVTLPPGWTINEMIEVVPSPNIGTPAYTEFARRTYVCTDQAGQYVCSSGSLEDCESQALTMAQAFSQQRPYDTVR
jgi:hypothetical protein